MSDKGLPGWASSVTNPERASSARVYDYFLGGSHNLDADRRVGEAAQRAMPWVPLQARTSRAFLRRAVRFMARAGIRQFLDIGSGIPTAGNVHQVARELRADSRVVYVDSDEVAVMQSRQLLSGSDQTTALKGDLTQPEQILRKLATAELSKLIDPTEPVGLLIVAVTHFVPDDKHPYEAVATLREWLPAGSYMALSQGAVESYTPQQVELIRAAYAGQGASIPTARTREQTLRFFDGLELVDPGLVYTPQWRPADDDPPFFTDEPQRSGSHAGVGWKAT